MALPQLSSGSYIITWKSPTSNGSRAKVTGTSTTIDGLASNTDYNFTLTTQNSASVGQPSDPLWIKTGLLQTLN